MGHIIAISGAFLSAVSIILTMWITDQIWKNRAESRSTLVEERVGKVENGVTELAKAQTETTRTMDRLAVTLEWVMKNQTQSNNQNHP